MPSAATLCRTLLIALARSRSAPRRPSPGPPTCRPRRSQERRTRRRPKRTPGTRSGDPSIPTRTRCRLSNCSRAGALVFHIASLRRRDKPANNRRHRLRRRHRVAAVRSRPRRCPRRRTLRRKRAAGPPPRHPAGDLNACRSPCSPAALPLSAGLRASRDRARDARSSPVRRDAAGGGWRWLSCMLRRRRASEHSSSAPSGRARATTPTSRGRPERDDERDA